MPTLGTQFVTLLLLALPVACLSWTVTHEEVFREPREWLTARSRSARRFWQRKFFLLFTCEYCFSHYVALAALLLTDYTLLFSDWRGSVLAFFALVWIANVYMSLYGRLRLDISHERQEIAVVEKELKVVEKELKADRGAKRTGSG